MKRLAAAGIVVLSVLVFFGSRASAVNWVGSHGFAGFLLDSPRGTSFEGVEETFVIPTVDPRCAPSKGMPTWVGMYGSTSIYPFIQNGVQIQDNNTIGGWYEIFDRNKRTSVWTVDFSARPGQSITLREVWGWRHRYVWFVWSNHATGQYTVVRRYLPGYYPTSPAVANFVAEDNWSAAGPPFYRIPWFGRINITKAQGEQVYRSTPFDRSGVPYRAGITKLNINNAAAEWKMVDHSGIKIRVDPVITGNGTYHFVQYRCY